MAGFTTDGECRIGVKAMIEKVGLTSPLPI